MDGFWPSNVTGWVALAGTVVAALWALLTFSRNNRIKAAELLLEIEKDYGPHIKTLLQIEYDVDFRRFFLGALGKTGNDPRPFTPEESEAIDRLEDVMRHFYVCENVRRLGVDSGAVDRLCAYYLRLIVSPERRELARYVKTYWPSVYYWGQVAGRPWPLRLLIYCKQIPERVSTWWLSPFATSPVLGHHHDAVPADRPVEVRRTPTGYSEFVSRMPPFSSGWSELRPDLEWTATVNTDPAKPQFVLSFCDIASPSGGSAYDATQLPAIVIDGSRYELKPNQSLGGEVGGSPVEVSVGGPRSILAAIAEAKAAKIEFGGKRYNIDERGLANCRELLKRSDAMAKR